MIANHKRFFIALFGNGKNSLPVFSGVFLSIVTMLAVVCHS